jgi:hypothetical protein
MSVASKQWYLGTRVDILTGTLLACLLAGEVIWCRCREGSVAEVCYVAVCYRVTLPEELGFETLSSFAIVATYYALAHQPRRILLFLPLLLFFVHAGRKTSYARRR